MGTARKTSSASGAARAEASAPAVPSPRHPDPEALDQLRQTAHGAHARLDALLHGVAAGVLFVGREGRVDLVNQALCRMLGVASAGQLVGQTSSTVARLLSDRFVDSAAFARQGLLEGDRRLGLVDGRVLGRELLPVGEAGAHGVLVLLREVSASAPSPCEVEPLHTVSLMDELTRLPNRRGFLAQANRRLRRAVQDRQAASLFCVDVEGMRNINQHFGHSAGDKALEEVTGVLRVAFRETDLLGRIGGDEFAVLALEVAEAQQPDILERLDRAVALLNARPARAWRLSLGVGAVSLDVAQSPLVEDWLAMADARLHAWKRGRTGSKD